MERAFELARESELLTIEKIRHRLKAEGYLDWAFQLSGRQIRRQLQAIIAAKREQMNAARSPKSEANEAEGSFPEASV